MVIVYFTNGNVVSLPAATQVEVRNMGTGGPAISCREAGNTEVARFRVSEIVGYEIRTEERSAGMH